MLMLSRRVGEKVNIYIRLDQNAALRHMIEKLGIDPCLLSRITDSISIELVRIEDVTGCEEELILGIDAPQHIDIVRSEIDRVRT